MKIEKVPAKPLPLPAPTYNVTGLSQEEYSIIKWALGTKSIFQARDAGFIDGVLTSVYDEWRRAEFAREVS